MDRAQIGKDAEQLAERFLLEHKLTLETRNFRCKGGEIDLIMRDTAHLVFIEVRYRNSNRFGGAIESVNYHKQRRLIIAAQLYLLRFPSPPPCRFDVIAINSRLQLHWIKDAFQL